MGSALFLMYYVVSISRVEKDPLGKISLFNLFNNALMRKEKAIYE